MADPAGERLYRQIGLAHIGLGGFHAVVLMSGVRHRLTSSSGLWGLLQSFTWKLVDHGFKFPVLTTNIYRLLNNFLALRIWMGQKQ